MVVPVAGWVTALVDIAIGVASKILDSFYEDVDSITDVMANLQSVCGCGYKMVRGVDVYNTPTSGLLITTNRNFWGNLKNTYTAYSSTTLYGENYYKGTWS